MYGFNSKFHNKTCYAEFYQGLLVNFIWDFHTSSRQKNLMLIS